MTLSFFNLCSCNLWWFLLKLAKNIFLPSNALVKRSAGLSPNNAQPVKLEAKCAPEGAQLVIITDFFFTVSYETKSDQERAKPSASVDKFLASKYCFYIYRTINKIIWWMHPSLLLPVRGIDWIPSAKNVMPRKLYLLLKWSPFWEIPQ